MSLLKILGACSGTEPMPELHHTSLVFSVGDRNYFFDAGENCSYSAYLSGVELLNTRAVFFSHTHYDHIGGLMGLLWTIKKLTKVKNAPIADGELKLYIPDIEVFKHIYKAFEYSEGGFDVRADVVNLGLVFEDENLKVSAFESNHLSRAEDGHIRSFSYRIDIKDKSVVFSGDVKSMDDLVSVVGEGCDLLLCETGHHSVADVCGFAESHNVKKLILTHHGREILQARPTVEQAIGKCKIPVLIAHDGTEINLD